MLNLQQLISDKTSRIIVTGASGWLGRTMVHILDSHRAQYLLLGSTNRFEQFSNGPKQIHEMSQDLVFDFAPTFVVDFAFLTREKTANYSFDQYVEINRELTSQARWMLELPTVKYFLSTSSGAAVSPKFNAGNSFNLNPYGYLKHESEQVLLSTAAEVGVPLVVARTWNVSGEFVTKVNGFAFSQMIASALTTRTIKIESKQPVYRRYVDVEDLLKVCMGTLAKSGKGRVIDSGGDLIDLVTLGQMIAAFIGSDVKISHSVDNSLESDSYYSDGYSWDQACRELDYSPLGISSQIAKVANALANRMEI